MRLSKIGITKSSFLFWREAFVWGLIILFLFLAIAFFMSPELTDNCTDSLFVCLEKSSSLSFWNQKISGIGCVLKNILCVFTRLF